MSVIMLLLILPFEPLLNSGIEQTDTKYAEPVDVEFVSRADGTPQRYVRLVPADFDTRTPHDVLIALHGHGSDRWQFVQQDRPECREVRRIAAERGMIFVSPDYRAPTSWLGLRPRMTCFRSSMSFTASFEFAMSLSPEVPWAELPHWPLRLCIPSVLMVSYR